MSKLLAYLVPALLIGNALSRNEPLTCSLGQSDEGLDPDLKEMTFDVGDGPETFLAYVQPDVATFYRDIEPPASKAVTPKFNGFGGMFVNMSNKPVKCSWEEYAGAEPALIETIDPFSSGGTATFPGHRFIFTPVDDPSNVLIRFHVIDYPNNVYIYDPYRVEGDVVQTQKNLNSLSQDDLESYRKIRKSYLFGIEYKKFTGRSYLVNFPRPRSPHFMWRADYFNQTHWVSSPETHLIKMPPQELLPPIKVYGKARSRQLQEGVSQPLDNYREPGQFNMTLKVISCAPRAFEVANFLSEVEVQHLLDLAAVETLSQSLTGDRAEASDISVTRTSYNSWLDRERSPIVDMIYRRAADLLRIDESLLRYRGDGEYPDLGTETSIAEPLQLVHYAPHQEYTAHHDFGYNSVNERFQAQRFATILLYLNEGMEGGATSFPRWVNAETFEELKVKPHIGKAVLFYSQLPDGNMDDFSQHEAKKVLVGEKWLANLWVWSPVNSDE